MSQWIDASPKDTGYSWIVAIGGFMMNMLIPGAIWKSFGILFLPMQERFHTSSAQLAWVPSLIIGLGLLLGTPATLLVNRFSTRQVAIMSGCLLLTGFTTSIFATNIVTLYITYGVCLGIGGGLSYSPAVIIVGEYFDQKRSIANGISSSGSGFAGIVFPVVIRYFLAKYGLNGTLLLMGGITFNMCVVGLLFRPHEFYRSRHEHKAKMSRLKSADLDNPSYERGLEKYDTQRCKPVQFTRDDGVEIIERCEKLTEREIKPLVSPAGGFQWYLLTYPTLLLYSISAGLSIACYTGLIIMTPPQAELNGYSADTASLLVSVMGIADIVSRLTVGFATRYVSATRIYHASMVVNAAALTFMAAFGDLHYAYMAAAVAVSAACAGCYLCLLPVVLSHVLGIRRLRSSFALVMCFCGLTNLSVPYAYGMLRDLTGSWNASLYFCASMSGFVALLICLLPVARRYSDRMDKRRGEVPC